MQERKCTARRSKGRQEDCRRLDETLEIHGQGFSVTSDHRSTAQVQKGMDGSLDLSTMISPSRHDEVRADSGPSSTPQGSSPEVG